MSDISAAPVSTVSSVRPVDTMYVVRALGIMAVVANHTGNAIPIFGAGGLNILFLLSGMSFAAICFSPNSGDIARNAVRFMAPLVIGSVLLVLLWMILFRRFEPFELAMVSNWITNSRVSRFPVWYTQVLIQIMLVLVPLFLALGLTDRFRSAPLRASMVALVLTVALATVAKLLFDTDELKDKLPHLHAWNFVLGWVFWAVLKVEPPTTAHRVGLTALTLPLMAFMFVGLAYPDGAMRLATATLPVLLLIWTTKLVLPRVLSQAALLVSQATLYIFFLHYPFLIAFDRVFSKRIPEVPLDLLQLLAGLIGPIVIWAMVVASQRTYRKMQRTVAA